MNILNVKPIILSLYNTEIKEIEYKTSNLKKELFQD